MAELTTAIDRRRPAWGAFPPPRARWLTMTSPGLGRDFSQGVLMPTKTVRGVLRNRVVGDGWIMGNFELRYRFVYFKFIGQNWYLGLSAFFDTGRVIEFIAVNEKVFNSGDGLEYPDGESDSDYFNFGAEKFHNSAGVGLYAAINQNFIVAINYAKALNEQDGNSGFYIGINYIF